MMNMNMKINMNMKMNNFMNKANKKVASAKFSEIKN